MKLGLMIDNFLILITSNNMTAEFAFVDIRESEKYNVKVCPDIGFFISGVTFYLFS